MSSSGAWGASGGVLGDWMSCSRAWSASALEVFSRTRRMFFFLPEMGSLGWARMMKVVGPTCQTPVATATARCSLVLMSTYT
ncbi:MAG: hypothetical protein R3B40_31840 [Polyangiales bacterium]